MMKEIKKQVACLDKINYSFYTNTQIRIFKIKNNK